MKKQNAKNMNPLQKLICVTIFGGITVCAMAIPVAFPRKSAPTLLEVFREMASNAYNAVNPPKAQQVKAVEISANYDCRSWSIVTAGGLNEELGGVLSGKGDLILKEARKNDLCPIFFAAVAMHESANGKSKCAREKNNTFGIFDAKTGRHKAFNSVNECIEFSAKLLGKSKLYCGGKNFTIAKIQKIYCPVGAKNDPSSLNQYWMNGVIASMKKIWNEKTIYVATL